MMKSTFDEAVAAVKSEREYQRAKWGPDEARAANQVPESWAVYIHNYLDRLMRDLTNTPDGPGLDTTAQDGFRKIAALAVAAMEQLGARQR